MIHNTNGVWFNPVHLCLRLNIIHPKLQRRDINIFLPPQLFVDILLIVESNEEPLLCYSSGYK